MLMQTNISSYREWHSILQRIKLQRNLPERPPLSDHLTKLPIGSSVSQIAISETSCKRPPKRKA